MIRVSIAGCLLAVAFASACATVPQSVLVGAGSGAAVGGGAGLLIGHNAEGAALGVVTGALTGGVLGYLFNKGKEKGQASSPNASLVEKYPFLTRPEVQTLWIPDTIEGDRFVEKHRVFVIQKNSSWSKDNE